MAYFSARDRAAVEGCVYDPAAEPGYEAIKGCLIWSDERPVNITSEGYDKLSDLWIARSYIHRGLPLAPRLQAAWERAVADGIRWPGFHRLVLSEADLAYYAAMIEDGGL
jgi:hypothetical protein